MAEQPGGFGLAEPQATNLGECYPHFGVVGKIEQDHL